MKDNEIGDGKSVDVLSVKRLESQKTVLPQDVFRNELIWFCYEMSKSLAFRIWMLLWLPLSVWWKLSNNWIYPLIVSLLVLFLGPFFVLVICELSRKRSLSKQLIQFCKEITKSTPSSDPHDWEVVAANLNSYFYENKVWNTKYFFFNAMSCQEAFRTTLLEPFSLKKDKLPRLSHLRIPSLTSKKHWEFILQKLKDNGSCLILRNHGALLAWKMLNFPRKLTDLSLPGF
ncbi:BAP_1a_G0000930.mRNA.1.CDS.1 [Saccharomyces cerevisiae]|nr:BAP_1a_G0000930.mRNA.1.CDS.1 [Saccharomyces cerevisiae]CAI7036049.1 BAP_1a_G0000930.mRNA.1.CDS.1 [Saccharomyces cerevisiae]